MNMCSKYVIAVAVISSCGAQICASPAQTSADLGKQAASFIAPVKFDINKPAEQIVAAQKIAAKKLGAIKMTFVSLGISVQPDLFVTAWEAQQEAIKALAEIDIFKKTVATGTVEQSFVLTHRDRLAIPVDSFLAPFRSEKMIVIPLVKESLGANSMIERLFNSPSSMTTKAFFDNEVQTMDTLKEMSVAFNILVGDLEMSLSSLAKKRYLAALKIKHPEVDIQKKALELGVKLAK